MRHFLLLITILITACGPQNSKPQAKSPTVVCLIPSVTETLCALGLEDHLVGVSNYCDYPQSVTQLPKCGGLYDINVEKILTLNPDLIFVHAGQDYPKLTAPELGLKVITLNQDSLSDLKHSLNQISQLLPCREAATTLQNQLEQSVKTIKAQLTQQSPKNVLMVLQTLDKMPIKEAYVAGTNTIFNELLTICGAQNVITATGYPRMTGEQMAALKPDLIIPIIADYQPQTHHNEVRDQWALILAAANLSPNQIKVLHGPEVRRPGPRVILTLQQLANLLQDSSPHAQ